MAPSPSETQPLLRAPVPYNPPSRLTRARRPKTNTCTRFIAITTPWILLYLIYNIIFEPDFTWLKQSFITRSYIGLPHKNWPNVNANVPFSELENIALTYPSADRAREWSRYYTSGPHLGGKNLSQALWTKARFEEFGFKTEIATYEIYVNYPVSHRMALLKEKKGKEGKRGQLGKRTKEDYKVLYEAKLEEPVIDEDETSGLEDRIPTFHGYSASGDVTGPLVFANYGNFDDYAALQANNVTIEGSVVLVKYGGVFRGLKVKRAQELGAVGVLIYSDPGDDGQTTVENGFKAYPDGPARHPEAVQRGSVQFLSLGPGDPTTPGYPSLPGVPRGDPLKFTPSIPSLPISYTDALPLLKALNSHGPLGSSLNWKNGGLTYLGVDYNVGPTPPNIVINLINEMEYTITPMWDVIATLEGTTPQEGTVIAGNHRDAWIAGGAGDPNSGSAALLEMAGSLHAMTKMGWKPTRNIILASWDGEEYGLLGSTEWAEHHAKWLSKDAIAYLNVDVGAIGSLYKASANPLLNPLIRQIADMVPAPGSTEGNITTVADTWSGIIRTLGSGSDYTVFQDFLGIPSIDMGFGSGRGDAVWMYHSNYDSQHWMEKFADPSFEYHATIASIWTLMALHLSTLPILNLNAREYANDLSKYLKAAEDGANAPPDSGHQAEASSIDDTVFLPSQPIPEPKTFFPPVTTSSAPKFDFTTLSESIASLRHTTTLLDKYISTTLLPAINHITTNYPSPPKWYQFSEWYRRYTLYNSVKSVNALLKTLDRNFLYEEGLDGREWFKHVVFAPGRWTGYAGVTFPGLGEALEDGELGTAERWGRVIGFAVLRAQRAVCDGLPGKLRSGEGGC